MTKYQPPLPPQVAAMLPDDPFEKWLVTQASLGHDRHWLNRNRPSLRKRWLKDPLANLPVLPARTPKVGNRYDEL